MNLYSWEEIRNNYLSESLMPFLRKYEFYLPEILIETEQKKTDKKYDNKRTARTG